MFEVKSVAQTAANIRIREVGQTKWHELALSLCEAFDEVVRMSEKKRESSVKSVQAAKTVSSPRAVFRAFFSFRCLHYLGAWNTLNFGSQAGHLS